MTATRTDTRTLPVSTSPSISSLRVGAVASVVGGLTLLAGFLVVPGPAVADVHAGGWVPGHGLLAAGFLLLALGLPAITASLGVRLGLVGQLGCAAVMARFILSTGSHLYYLWVLPTLAAHPDLHAQLVDDGRLTSIYGGHGDVVNVVLGVGMLGLAVGLVRMGRGLRAAAVLVGLAAVAEVLGTPFGLVLLALTCAWLGVRILVRGDAAVALRTAR